MRYRKHLLILLIVACTASASPVWAAAVTNLSDVPQTIILDNWGHDTQVTIPPGRTFRIPGMMRLTYRGRVVRIESNEEYAIWNDGALGPQWRTRRRSVFPF